MKVQKLAAQQRKIDMLLQNNKSKVNKSAAKSFSGLAITQEKPIAGRINVAKIDQWLANIERNNFVLEQTT